MSTESSPLTQEQLAQVNELLNSTKQDLISSVIAAVQAQQTEIAATAKTEIDQAVTKNQRILLATVQDGKGVTSSSKWAKFWEGFKVVFPVVATALLGFLVWNWQSNIQKKIDRQTEVVKAELAQQTEVVKTELAVKQDFVKRKLDLYEDILIQMVETGSKIYAAQGNSEMKAACGPALLKFNETVKSKRLYISAEAFNALLDFWQAGIDVLRGKGTLEDLQAKNSIAEDRIAQDLNVKNLGKLNLSKQ